MMALDKQLLKSFMKMVFIKLVIFIFLDIDELVSMGFGEKTSQNLINQLQRSRQESIEDWRFLAAFGVHRLGMGNCENLLKNYSIEKSLNFNSKTLQR
jgi:DNA ligase (NAD+)